MVLSTNINNKRTRQSAGLLDRPIPRPDAVLVTMRNNNAVADPAEPAEPAELAEQKAKRLKENDIARIESSEEGKSKQQYNDADVEHIAKSLLYHLQINQRFAQLICSKSMRKNLLCQNDTINSVTVDSQETTQPHNTNDDASNSYHQLSDINSNQLPKTNSQKNRKTKIGSKINSMKDIINILCYLFRNKDIEHIESVNNNIVYFINTEKKSSATKLSYYHNSDEDNSGFTKERYLKENILENLSAYIIKRMSLLTPEKNDFQDFFMMSDNLEDIKSGLQTVIKTFKYVVPAVSLSTTVILSVHWGSEDSLVKKIAHILDSGLKASNVLIPAILAFFSYQVGNSLGIDDTTYRIMRNIFKEKGGLKAVYDKMCEELENQTQEAKKSFIQKSFGLSKTEDTNKQIEMKKLNYEKASEGEMA